MTRDLQAPLHRSATVKRSRYWRAFRRVPDFVLPRVWHDWILDPGSLTRRLQVLGQGDFSVEILFLGWARPTLDERRVLNLPDAHHALIREVVLRCKGEPVVKARSVMPATTLTGKERQLRFLGNRPLGAFLFRSRNMRRTAIEIGAMNWHEEDWIYGRRSVFLLHDKPLLVSELFLPALLAQSRKAKAGMHALKGVP